MKNPIPRKIFLLRNFAPARYIEFRDLMYALNTQFHLETITEEEMDSALLSFWLRLLTNTLMMNFLPYSIRRPFYYVIDLILCADFRREEFGRIFDAYEYEQGTQIIGFINYLGMTGQLDVCEHFNMFADAENLEQAVAIWEGYQDLTILTPSK